MTWARPATLQPEAPFNEKLAFKYFQFSCGNVFHGLVQYRRPFSHILRMAHSEPIIWHATVALGSFHHNRAVPDLPNGRVLGLRHYGKAVAALNERLTSGERMPSHLLFAASLLFSTYEVLMREYYQASLHINGSVTYLYETLESHNFGNSNSSGDDVFACFVDCFVRLAISASIFRGKPPSLNHDPFVALSNHLHPDVRFKNTIGASRAVLLCLTAMRELEAWQEPDALDVQAEPWLAKRLMHSRDRLLRFGEYWEEGMQDLDPSLMEAEDRQRARLLRMWMSYCKIYISTLGGDEHDEMRYDNFLASFDEITTLAKAFLHIGDGESREEGSLRYPCFSVHIGVSHILWFVIKKCRDFRIRSRALELLRGCNHEEYGSWDGYQIAHFAEHVIQLEQGYGAICAAAVSQDKRLSDAAFDTIAENNTLYCRRLRVDSVGGMEEWAEKLETPLV